MLESVHALVEHAIDYAGLFPPAALDMTRAAANYSRYLAGEHNWMLGRFVVTTERLHELENVLVANPPTGKWRIAALTGTGVSGAIPAILAFNAHTRDAAVDSLEGKATTIAEIRDAASAIPEGFTIWFEIPTDPDPTPLIEALAEARFGAKIRTGGITEDAFPPPEHVARFIARCDDAHVPFKATAGLHHAVRGLHRLTYEPDSPSSTMYGFLNILLAAAFRWSGTSMAETTAILTEQDGAFRFARKGVVWGQHWISTVQIRSARHRLIASFGSCSFDEPVADLSQRGLL